RLHGGQCVGGCGERTLFGDREQGVEMAELHGRPLWSCGGDHRCFRWIPSSLTVGQICWERAPWWGRTTRGVGSPTDSPNLPPPNALTGVHGVRNPNCL